MRQTCENQTCKLYEVNEAYTSKTCSKCGYIDNSLGSKDVYNCPKCKLKISRDYNGAVNILLRYVSMYVSQIFKI